MIKFIKKSESNEYNLKCEFCRKEIATFLNDTMSPSPEDCYKRGNIPVPNFGWFCSQKCAINFEKKFGIQFSRTPKGMIDYYNK